MYGALGAIGTYSKNNKGDEDDSDISSETEEEFVGYFKVTTSNGGEFKIYAEPKGSDSEDCVTSSSDSEDISEEQNILYEK